MNRTICQAGLSAVAVLALSASAASATIIGGSSQSSSQGVNATQLANAGTATGNVINVGGANPAPASTQTSVNALDSRQGVGSPDGGDVFISPTGTGPTQSNQQGSNSMQLSANGAISSQASVNALGNSQIVGGGFDCLRRNNDCVASTIIGTPTQANQQGVNASQSTDGGLTTGDSISTPTVIINGLGFAASQTSFNPLESTQLVLG